MALWSIIQAGVTISETIINDVTSTTSLNTNNYNLYNYKELCGYKRQKRNLRLTEGLKKIGLKSKFLL